MPSWQHPVPQSLVAPHVASEPRRAAALSPRYRRSRSEAVRGFSGRTGETPIPTESPPETDGPTGLVGIPVLGGLHHRYVRVAAGRSAVRPVGATAQGLRPRHLRTHRQTLRHDGRPAASQHARVCPADGLSRRNSSARTTGAPCAAYPGEPCLLGSLHSSACPLSNCNCPAATMTLAALELVMTCSGNDLEDLIGMFGDDHGHLLPWAGPFQQALK